jgi:hypothetical protein
MRRKACGRSMNAESESAPGRARSQRLHSYVSSKRNGRPGQLDAAGITRLALTPIEAAQTLGVSEDYFNEHIRPELRWVRRGRKAIVAVDELRRWLDTSAARTLEEHR